MRFPAPSLKDLAKAIGVGVATAVLLSVVMVPAFKLGVSPLPKPLGLAYAETLLGRTLPLGGWGREGESFPVFFGYRFNHATILFRDEGEKDMASTGRPSGSFREDARWHDDRMAVEFTLDLREDTGKREIVCRASREALQDAVRDTGELSATNAIRLYRHFKSDIHAAVNRKVQLGEFDADGSITIKSADLPS